MIYTKHSYDSLLIASLSILIALAAQPFFSVAQQANEPRPQNVARLSAPFGKKEIASAIDSLGRSKGMKPVVKNKIGMEFRLIPAGEFMMGSPETEKDRGGGEHQHKVELTQPFYIGTYEVTEEQWGKTMGSLSRDAKDVDTSNFPVFEDSWKDAQEFIDRLNEKFSIQGYRYRLPTEAEWEYACRAGTETIFHFGDKLDEKHANCGGTFPREAKSSAESSKQKSKSPVAVGSYPCNAFGLHDMHGNASEWCLDWYDENFYQRSLRKDPINKTKPDDFSADHVARGGCFL